MLKTTQYLNDEHMQLYEWSGTGITCSMPAKSKRTHPWHASYAVLAVLTSLLILNGCDNKSSLKKADEQVGQAAQGMKEEASQPKGDVAAPPPETAPEAGRTPEQAPAQAGNKAGQPSEGVQKQ